VPRLEAARLTGMPRQNRVTPLGELIADPARGLVYGNRGCLHFHETSLDELPDGAFVLQAGRPYLVLGQTLLSWTPAGYGAPEPRPAQRRAQLITPPSLMSVLHAGWQPLVPFVHPSADVAA
jgi:hypothetical protein